MNIITRDIMARFGLEAEDALEVQWHLESYFAIDFSEASEAEHNEAYDEAYNSWKESKANV